MMDLGAELTTSKIIAIIGGALIIAIIIKDVAVGLFSKRPPKFGAVPIIGGMLKFAKVFLS